jgi:hypothetical protein
VFGAAFRPKQGGRGLGGLEIEGGVALGSCGIRGCLIVKQKLGSFRKDGVDRTPG